MCGIVGMVIKANNGFSVRTEKIFNELLYVDVLRGDDSTGIIGVENDSTFHIAKEATAGAWFLNSFEVESKIPKALFNRGRAIIGHNRKKTMGHLSDKNAHPFVVGDHFGLVHNGTLFGHRSLANVDVDSEALAIVLEKAFGEDDMVGAIAKTLSEVNGAYALAMYDQRTHSIYIVRNAERPLYIAENADGWFWCSEKGALDWILSRNGCVGASIEVPEDTLITINLTKPSISMEKLTLKKTFPPATETAHVSRTGGKSISTKAYLKQLRQAHIGETLAWWPEKAITDPYGVHRLIGETFDPELSEYDHDVLFRSEKNPVEHLIGEFLQGQIFSIERTPSGKLIFWVTKLKKFTGNTYEDIIYQSEEELKKYQLTQSSKRSVFETGLQSLENEHGEHAANAV